MSIKNPFGVVTLPSRVAYGKFSCGLGVRAVRAGSIGRDGQRLGERDEYPPEGAGGLGPRPLRQAWKPWFQNHGGFRFVGKDLFIDGAAQKALYRWRLEWASSEKGHEGKPEKRRGVDVIHFREGKIHGKFTYAKTILEIDGPRVGLTAGQPG